MNQWINRSIPPEPQSRVPKRPSAGGKEKKRGSAELGLFELRGPSFEHKPRTVSEMKVRATLLIAAAGPPKPCGRRRAGRRRETAYFSHGASRSRRGGLFDQFSEPESLVEFPHQDQACLPAGRAERADFVSHPLGTDLRSVFIAFTPS